MSNMYDIMNITIRDVDEDVYSRFKAVAVKRKMTVGQAITLAMIKYQQETKPKGKLSDLKSVSLGPGSERLSEQIDEILYS